MESTMLTQGIILDSATYTLAHFQHCSGLGKYALLQARRKGLRILRIGGRCFVRGKDFSEFLARHADVNSDH